MVSASLKAEGFLLLTIGNATLAAPFVSPPQQTGTLQLECVTIPLSQTDDPDTNPFNGEKAKTQRDVWLVLRINQFEQPLSAIDPIQHSSSLRSFTFRCPEGVFVVALPAPTTSAAAEDLETFEVLLSQYGVLRETDGEKGDDATDMKGRLILVDEQDGEMIGTLGEQYQIKEDAGVSANAKAPVIIEMPEEGDRELRIRAVDPDEQDYIYKSAAFISQGIIYATDMIGKGMGMASDYYIKNSTPRPEPLVFSESTKVNIRRAHAVTGTAVKVTAKTTGLIHSLVDYAADKLQGSTPPPPPKSAAYAPGTPGMLGTPGIPGTPPRLPPRAEKSAAPSPSPMSSSTNLASGSQTPQRPPLPPRKSKRLLNRLLISTDLLITTVENSAQQLIVSTTDSLANGLGHKYGPDMHAAVHTIGDTAKNVGVVYIDLRGVGRRALIKRAGKRVIKGKIGKKEVVFGGEEPEDGEKQFDIQSAATTSTATKIKKA